MTNVAAPLVPLTLHVRIFTTHSSATVLAVSQARVVTKVSVQLILRIMFRLAVLQQGPFCRNHIQHAILFRMGLQTDTQTDRQTDRQKTLLRSVSHGLQLQRH